MADRPFTHCKKTNCFNLTNDKTGYCYEHKYLHKEKIKKNFERLDKKKTPEQIKFYHSIAWRKVSEKVRRQEPFCRRCKASGYLVPAVLVHHNPEVDILISQGLSPYDEKYLEPLCHNCHQQDLRKKQLL